MRANDRRPAGPDGPARPDDLSCQELVEIVTGYLEGALAPDARARFEEHLRICEGCDAYLDQMRTTIRLTGRLRATSVSGEAKERLLRAFRDYKRRP